MAVVTLRRKRSNCCFDSWSSGIDDYVQLASFATVFGFKVLASASMGHSACAYMQRPCQPLPEERGSFQVSTGRGSVSSSCLVQVVQHAHRSAIPQ